MKIFEEKFRSEIPTWKQLWKSKVINKSREMHVDFKSAMLVSADTDV